jgi:hypothetical protein
VEFNIKGETHKLFLVMEAFNGKQTRHFSFTDWNISIPDNEDIEYFKKYCTKVGVTFMAMAGSIPPPIKRKSLVNFSKTYK